MFITSKSPEDKISNFTKFINLNQTQIKIVYNSTVSQSQSHEWIAQRKGRITASKFKRVYTKMISISNYKSDDAIALYNIIYNL